MKLTNEDKKKIEEGLNKGLGLGRCAKSVGRDREAVSWEVKRGTMGEASPQSCDEYSPMDKEREKTYLRMRPSFCNGCLNKETCEKKSLYRAETSEQRKAYREAQRACAIERIAGELSKGKSLNSIYKSDSELSDWIARGTFESYWLEGKLEKYGLSKKERRFLRTSPGRKKGSKNVKSRKNIKSK